MMRAYLVTGAESSGNRYMVRLLCEAGCVGRGDHVQPFDGEDATVHVPQPRPLRIALHRSLPHGGLWPDLEGIVAGLWRQGYVTTVLVMVRDQEIQARSQVKNRHVADHERAAAQIHMAHRAILSAVVATGADFVLVPYGSLGRTAYRAWLRERLNLPGEFAEVFADGDRAYEG